MTLEVVRRHRSTLHRALPLERALQRDGVAIGQRHVGPGLECTFALGSTSRDETCASPCLRLLRFTRACCLSVVCVHSCAAVSQLSVLRR